MPTPRELTNKIVRDLTEKGLLIEAGFQSFRILAIPRDAGAQQIEDMRGCFFAGAQHVFGSIMQTLDADSEPTEGDMRRMKNINDELDLFIAAFRKKHNLPAEPARAP